MIFKLAITAALLGSALAFAPGCAVDAPEDEADLEEAASSEDELSARAQRFVGAYHGQSSVRPPTFEGLVFKLDGTFFGDVDTGIRCIQAPCPSSVHLEGRYTATKSYLRLSPKSGPANGFYGRYRYVFAGEKLTLSSTSIGAGWSNSLSKKISYCAQPTDCGGQGLIVPSCMGSWTCGSGIGSQSSNTCGWKCGSFPPPPPPADAIWPASATKLVAESFGSGFTPPPPPGSNCALGRQKYALDRSTRKLTWEACDRTGSNAPLLLKTGSATITTAELTAVNQAMNVVAVATDDACGADKPLMQIKVTTPAGETTYTDSFYRCDGGTRIYVDNIGGVFSALRAAAE